MHKSFSIYISDAENLLRCNYEDCLRVTTVDGRKLSLKFEDLTDLRENAYLQTLIIKDVNTNEFYKCSVYKSLTEYQDAYDIFSANPIEFLFIEKI